VGPAAPGHPGRCVEDKARLGRVRWVVERTVSWPLRFKRLGPRYDRTEATLRPLLTLASSIINLRRLIQTAPVAGGNCTVGLGSLRVNVYGVFETA
jgi:hypothetical protein